MMRKSEATRGVLKDPFDAIPIIPESVEIREDREGNVQLRVPQDLGRMREKVADWLGQDHSSKVALDEHGSFFIRQIDGERDLKMIVVAMVEHSGRARKDVEEGVVLYTKKLMTKNMLALKIVK